MSKIKKGDLVRLYRVGNVFATVESYPYQEGMEHTGTSWFNLQYGGPYTTLAAGTLATVLQEQVRFDQDCRNNRPWPYCALVLVGDNRLLVNLLHMRKA